MRRALLLSLPALALASVTALAAPAIEPIKPPQARELVLPSGLQVSLIRHGAVPKATIVLEVATDVQPSRWFGQFFAALLLEGTTERSGKQLSDAVAAAGGELTATAKYDTVELEVDVLGADAPRVCALVAEVATRPAFPAAEVPRLRDEVRRNLAQTTASAGRRAALALLAALFPPSAHGGPIPDDGELARFDAERARAFHRRNFVGARAHLYVIGRFDLDATEAAVRRAFADLPRGEPVVDAPLPAPPGRTIHVIDRPGSVQSSIAIGARVPDASRPGYTAVQVANVLLGESFSSRLFRTLREQYGYAYTPHSHLEEWRDSGMWVAALDVETSVTLPALRETLRQVEGLAASPAPDDELQTNRTYAAGNFVVRAAGTAGLLDEIRRADRHHLDRRYLVDHVRDLQAVTAAELQAAAAAHLPADGVTIVVVGDLARIRKDLETLGPLVTDPSGP